MSAPAPSFETLLREAFARLRATTPDIGPLHCAPLGDRPAAHPGRQVFKAHNEALQIVIKVDQQGDQTNRLRVEHGHLEQLSRHYARFDGMAVARPLLLDPGGRYLITEFAPGQTAQERVAADADPQVVRQTLRRAGRWLNILHRSGRPDRIRPQLGWMPDTIDRLLERDELADPAAAKPHVARFRKLLRSSAPAHSPRVRAHGDFHGANLIMSATTTTGVDLSECTRKLAVYDMVDMLVDLDLRRPGDWRLGPMGIAEDTATQFFHWYRQDIDWPLLALCLHGRLLIDWLSVTPERLLRSPYQERKFTALSTRLEHLARKAP